MSKKTSFLISDSISNETALDADAHKSHAGSSKKNFQLESESQQSNTYESLLEQACISERTKMERNFKMGNSCWFTTKLPEREREREREREFCFIEERIPGFQGAEIRLTLTNIPVDCDGSGQHFHVQHALICKNVGLITQRHNEI